MGCYKSTLQADRIDPCLSRSTKRQRNSTQDVRKSSLSAKPLRQDNLDHYLRADVRGSIDTTLATIELRMKKQASAPPLPRIMTRNEPFFEDEPTPIRFKRGSFALSDETTCSDDPWQNPDSPKPEEKEIYSQNWRCSFEGSLRITQRRTPCELVRDSLDLYVAFEDYGLDLVKFPDLYDSSRCSQSPT